MPEAVATQAANGDGGNSGWYQQVAKSVGIFLLVQAGVKMLPTIIGKINGTPVTTVNPAASSVPGSSDTPTFPNTPVDDGTPVTQTRIPGVIRPRWQENTMMDISMYISSLSASYAPLNTWPSDSLVMHEKDLRLGDWKISRDISTSFSVPTEVQNNATLYAHFFVAQSGTQMDPTASDYDSSTAYHWVRPLTQYLLKKKESKKRNLLSGVNKGEVQDEDQPTEAVVTSFYHPNFTLSIIPNLGEQAVSQIHPAVWEHLQSEMTDERDEKGRRGWYYPAFYLNTFWQLRNHMTEINSTVTRLPLNIHLNTLSGMKFSLMAAMDFGMKQNAQKAASGQSLGTGGDGSEMEQIKQVLLDSNIYLLATTGVVSIFHMIFEMLAFKSDVSHWRNKKDNVGVSFRSILANVVMQAIILLYLIDNTENTSWMILFGQGMGIFVEAWKITKTVDVRIRPTAADSTSPFWRHLPYTLVFEDKHKLSDTEKQTQEYDQIAFRYLYMAAVPLLLAYAAYSLAYDSHKSWYSYIIATLVGSVYAYGFLMMVPSLYINYRLGSVAHMPARAMTYKFLNTFIDDLFAFTIKMPTLHRLATLRDDVIFFIYLYQSYKYKVDFTRVNEFGQGGDEEEVADKVANEPLKAPAGGKAEGRIEGKVGDKVQDRTESEAGARVQGKADVKAIIEQTTGKTSGASKGGAAKKRKL